MDHKAIIRKGYGRDMGSWEHKCGLRAILGDERELKCRNSSPRCPSYGGSTLSVFKKKLGEGHNPHYLRFNQLYLEILTIEMRF